jgi:hypothetical protein
LARSTGTEDPLKFQAGQYVGVPTIGKCVAQDRIIRNESGRKHDGSHSDLVNLWLLLEVDCACGAELLTRFAPLVLLEVDAVLGINDILEGNCLGIIKVCSLPPGQAGIVDIRDTLRAFLCTCAAGNAQIRIDVARRLENRYLKIAGLTGHALHLR